MKKLALEIRRSIAIILLDWAFDLLSDIDKKYVAREYMQLINKFRSL